MVLSVIIPCFNESECINGTLQKIYKEISQISTVTSFEVIVVDDHSTDGTFEKVSSAGFPNLKILRLKRNYGSHSAIQTGLRQATGDAALFISADGQDDISILPEMFEKLRSGSQVVWGSRKFSKRSFTRDIFYFLLKKFPARPLQIDIRNADFFLLTKNITGKISFPLNSGSLFAQIACMPVNQCEVKYNRKERISGKSGWTFRKKMFLAVKWLKEYSTLPAILGRSLFFMILFCMTMMVTAFFREFSTGMTILFQASFVITLVLYFLRILFSREKIRPQIPVFIEQQFPAVIPDERT